MITFKFFRNNDEFQLMTFDLVAAPSIDFNLHTVQVTGETRRLRATWTPELAQEIESFHNIDIENELISLLSAELSAEIDREIIRNILALTSFKFFRG